MKKHLKVLIFTSIVILLPVLAGIILWNKLPDPMPSHWNAQGEVDGWSSKAFGVFGFPLILLPVHWLTALVTLADPKKQNISDSILNLIFWIVPVLSVFVSWFTYFAALGKEVPMESIFPLFFGALFVVLGAVLPRCKQNYSVGIKLPWTLNSEENWNRTHRLAGPVWIVGGVLSALTGFSGSFWPMFIIILVIALIPCIYSYLLHRKGI